jgi:hypothetical protein
VTPRPERPLPKAPYHHIGYTWRKPSPVLLEDLSRIPNPEATLKELLLAALPILAVALAALAYLGSRRPDDTKALRAENAELRELVDSLKQTAYDHLELIAAEKRESGTSEENLARVTIDEIRSFDARQNRKALP